MTLTPEEIRDLCRQRDAGVVATASFHEPRAAALLAGADAGEVARLISDGRAARHRMVEENLGLVGHIVNRSTRLGWLDRDDCFQEGVLALTRAVDRYDPDRGSFAGFAAPFIRGAVATMEQTAGGQLHLTGSQARGRHEVRATVRRLEAAGLPAGAADVARSLGRSEQWVRQVQAYSRHATLNPATGDLEIADARAQERLDAIGQTHAGRFLPMLPDAERRVLELVHGFGGEPRSLAAASRELGVSETSARRLLDAGHAHLRTLVARVDEQLREAGTVTAARPAPVGMPHRVQRAPARSMRR